MRMFKIFSLFFTAAVLWGTAGSLWADTSKEPGLRMEVNPTKVYEGDSFQLLIHLDNADTDTPPDTGYLDAEFTVDYRGPQRRNSSRITIINGVTTKEEDKGVTFVYILTPKSSGKIEINPPEMTIDGKVLNADPVVVEVIPPSDQDLVKLELSTDAESIYPLVPFTVMLSVYVRELPPPYADKDPVGDISREVGPPELGIVWADDAALPPGLVPKESWQDWISPYQESRGGFAVNGIRNGGPFDFSWAFGDSGRNKATFLPKSKKCELADESGNPLPWRRYDFSRTFTAEKVGPVTFDAVSIKGIFAKAGEEDKLTVEQIYAVSQPLTVEIRDVPQEGRPADYIGAFGQFDLKTNITPLAGRVGEAMTLTLSLEGTGSVLNVTAPDLAAVPAVTDQFKIYPPTEKTGEGSAQWTWSLRPLTEGNLSFPAVSVSYFDVKKEKYVTLTSEPIPLTIEKSQVTAAGSGFSKPAAGPLNLETMEGGIFGNRPEPAGRINRQMTVKTWLTGTGVIWGISLAACAGIGFIRRRQDSEQTRRIRRFTQSRELLAAGLKNWKSANRETIAAGSRNLLDAFLLPVADRFSTKIETVSAGEFSAMLKQMADSGLISGDFYTSLTDALERLDGILYGSERLDAEQTEQWRKMHEQWLACVEKIDGKKQPANRSKGVNLHSVIGLLAILSIFMTGCGGKEDRWAHERFQEAAAKFEAAENQPASEVVPDTTNGFEESARLYDELLNKGIINGAILFNRGNAYYRAGKMADALASWRRAKQYLPNDPYLAANIDSVLPNTLPEKRPLFETIFFWQNYLSGPMLGRIAWFFALAAAVLMLILVWKRDFSAKVCKWMRYSLLACTILFAAAGISFLYDAARFAPGNHGILSTETSPRKGASARYEPIYRDPLPALTEFTIRDTRPGWIEAQFPDAQTGWLPEENVVRW